MTLQELKDLREKYYKEIERREYLKKLVEDEMVQEFLRVSRYNYKNLTEYDKIKLVENLINKKQFQEPNGIYVLTRCAIFTPDYYGEDYWTVDVKFDSDKIHEYTCTNIENFKQQYIVSSHDYRPGQLLERFREQNIILNPTNSSDNYNNLYEVRKEFVLDSIENDQEHAKKLLLEKYKRI